LLLLAAQPGRCAWQALLQPMRVLEAWCRCDLEAGGPRQLLVGRVPWLVAVAMEALLL
jgi:hypothetical protein